VPGGATLARAYNIVGRVNGVPPGNQWALSRPFYSNTMNKDNMLQQVVGLPDKEKLHIMMGEKE
jgi:hypothetical protein